MVADSGTELRRNYSKIQHHLPNYNNGNPP